MPVITNPTEQEVRDLIETNLADFSNIEPEEHRDVLNTVLNYVNNSSTQSTSQDYKLKYTTPSIGARVLDLALLENGFYDSSDFDNSTLFIRMLHRNTNLETFITEQSVNIASTIGGFSVAINLSILFNTELMGVANIEIRTQNNNNFKII